MSASIAKPTDKAHLTLIDATLSALWVQWRAIGGMTSANRPARSTVDAEALILASLALRSHEPRLDDVLFDWLVTNSELLSVQRIKNLTRAFPSTVSKQLGGVGASVAAAGKDFRWSGLATNTTRRKRSSQQVRRAIAPNLYDPAAIMLRLRVGIGIGNKADVLSFLLGIGAAAATVREIADATGYTVHALHRTVGDLAAAGLIHPTDTAPAQYSVRSKGWQNFLESERLTKWYYWLRTYAFVAEFDQWTSDTRDRTVTPYALGVQARDLLRRHQSVFQLAGAKQLRAGRGLDADPVAHFEASVAELANWMIERA